MRYMLSEKQKQAIQQQKQEMPAMPTWEFYIIFKPELGTLNKRNGVQLQT